MIVVLNLSPTFGSTYGQASKSPANSLRFIIHKPTDKQSAQIKHSISYLRCIIIYQQDDWSNILHLDEFAYNNNGTLFYQGYTFLGVHRHDRRRRVNRFVCTLLHLCCFQFPLRATRDRSHLLLFPVPDIVPPPFFVFW